MESQIKSPHLCGAILFLPVTEFEPGFCSTKVVRYIVLSPNLIRLKDYLGPSNPVPGAKLRPNQTTPTQGFTIKHSCSLTLFILSGLQEYTDVSLYSMQEVEIF